MLLHAIVSTFVWLSCICIFAVLHGYIYGRAKITNSFMWVTAVFVNFGLVLIAITEMFGNAAYVVIDILRMSR